MIPDAVRHVKRKKISDALTNTYCHYYSYFINMHEYSNKQRVSIYIASQTTGKV